ncbi:DMT family transporter [Roseibaca sp. V10]|uniref:DMT family transporter n=1 Tax=Roseinatronobacter domitianus TaxID=2940293 RepID=A0ABT0M465_9RHOB|nr:DMT family transporter [Roseibaca domitiana]MCL1629649.1 DMT family transporter [Roseibaca domitiana]
MITTKPDSRPLLGMLWMLLTGFCFVAVTALVKYLGDDLPAAQQAFLRYLLGLVFLIPMWPALRAARISRQAITVFGARGFIHALGVILWFYAMTQIPLAEVTAMNYLSPIYVTLGAALFLGEKLALRRIMAVLVAFLGALIILRPGLREVSSGHIAMIGTAIFFAGSYLMAKRMSGQVSASVVVAMLSLTVTICLAPFAYAVWVPPTGAQLLGLLAVAAFATAGHYTMTLAFAAAPVTVTQPVTFLQLVWAVALGALVFAEPVDLFVVLGGMVIMASVLFITWREAMLRKQERRAVPAP